MKSILKEAIAKASREEQGLAGKLAHAVLEGEHDRAASPSSWADEVARHETALLAKQRTVDALKLALSRLPEAAQTF